MSFSLSSFSSDFWGDIYKCSKPTRRPTNIADAIRSIPDSIWSTMAQDIFDCEPDTLTIEMVLAKIMETDMCLNLTPPVEVLIDEDGFYSILVYE